MRERYGEEGGEEKRWRGSEEEIEGERKRERARKRKERWRGRIVLLRDVGWKACYFLR